MYFNRARADPKVAESIAQASVQRATSSSRRPESEGRDNKGKVAFFQMMNEWFAQYIITNPAVQQPPPPAPQLVPEMPQGTESERIRRSSIDKIRKYGAKEFRTTTDDDAKKAEFWFENTIWVLDELSGSPANCLKCVVSLLKDTTYHWWKTISSVVPSENITWEFFQTECIKKYIS